MSSLKNISKKSKTSGFTDLFSSFFGKKSVFREKNMCLTILKPFCGIMILRQLLTVFLFFSEIFPVQKSKTLGFTDLFSNICRKQLSKTCP